MNWPQIRDTLAAIVPKVCSIPVKGVVWKGSLEESSIVVGTRAVLSTNSIVAIGIPETRLAPVHDENQNVLICGPRAFTWSIQIECQNQGPDTTARVIVDQIVIRMNRESIRSMLVNSNLAMSNVLAITHRDYLASGRLISWAMVDFKMLASENDQDTDEDSGQWIGESLVDGTIDDGNGNVIADVSLDINTL